MLIAGLCMGCDGGIGSTYNLMPAEFCKIYQSFREGDLKTAQKYQIKVNRVIEILLSMNFYGAIKYLLNKRGINCGTTRKPFSELNSAQLYQLDKIHETISHS
jgi:N-acetylneuraminate lyase